MTRRYPWEKPELESNLPHIIVDANGKRVRPHPAFPPFKNRGTATRLLNQLRRRRNPTLLGDPDTWRVEPVR